MSAHTSLILFISAIIITVGGMAVVYDVAKSNINGAGGLKSSRNVENQQEDLVLVNAVAFNIANESYKYAKFQVKYEGEGGLNINDTFIQLRTDTSIADLQYRNGTTSRSVTDGFYTQ